MATGTNAIATFEDTYNNFGVGGSSKQCVTRDAAITLGLTVGGSINYSGDQLVKFSDLSKADSWIARGTIYNISSYNISNIKIAQSVTKYNAGEYLGTLSGLSAQGSQAYSVQVAGDDQSGIYIVCECNNPIGCYIGSTSNELSVTRSGAYHYFSKSLTIPDNIATDIFFNNVSTDCYIKFINNGYSLNYGFYPSGTGNAIPTSLTAVPVGSLSNLYVYNPNSSNLYLYIGTVESNLSPSNYVHRQSLTMSGWTQVTYTGWTVGTDYFITAFTY